MAKKKRQRISYVLPLASTPGGHRLGVNGLAVDSDNSILYTGGRDGVICAWNLDPAAHKASASDNSQGGSTSKDDQSTTFRAQVQAHTHWVNDICLAQNNTALVSASSDVTVKVWKPHGNDVGSAQTIGVHSDYVKCVATPQSNAHWVASGGLDHKICLWDLNGAGQSLEINVGKVDNVVKGSIYTLCAKESVIASGGPESVVRLWDTKSGKSITKLVGHTDNIRDILMSEEGDILLTASSDQTVKVWSLAAGRCMHTLTMHNESVWCMYSDHPNLSVFYSGDRSGLVAKTDVRYAEEFDEGTSVALCQDHEGVSRIVTAGDYLWTASSSSSVNRWQDVNTEADIETPPESPRHQRSSSGLSKDLEDAAPTMEDTTETNGVSKDWKIPFTGVLRLSITAPHPGRKLRQQSPTQSPPSIRKASEAILDADTVFVIPIRNQPAETLEGQNGLIKHALLNDRKRVLTLDTAGEVVLWDLLKCVPIRSYGRRHLEDVVPEVNTTESVANWCAVDTRTGKLSVMLEENYCFDAEVYADEIDIPEKIEFRDDQRINLGKWVLRNLFTTLLDEEIKRDEIYRRTFRTDGQPTNGMQRNNAPLAITLPPPSMEPSTMSPESMPTPRATNGAVTMTPNLNIKIGTPGTPSGQTQGQTTSILPSTAEEGTELARRPSRMSQPPGTMDRSSDYFTSAAPTPSDAPSDSSKVPTTPGEGLTSSATAAPGTTTNPASPTDDKEEKKKSTIFGKKFQMNFQKKLGRNSADAKQIIAASDESKSAEDMSDKSSEQEKNVLEDNFFGVVQRVRQEFAEHQAQAELPPSEQLPGPGGQPLLSGVGIGITPSLPNETPVLKPPPHTLVIIQEDNPESGGLADLYRGEISQLGREADVLEKIAPMWLGELLLKNHIPYKDTVKVSFILQPYQDLLPSIASPDGNARLNANRMLRCKKILAYVAERIEAPPPAPPAAPAAAAPANPSDPDPSAQARTPAPAPAPGQPVQQDPEDPKLRPEDYLELYCHDQLVHPNTTLATLRVHVWRTGGDVVIYYKSNGRKKLRLVGEGAPGASADGGAEAQAGKADAVEGAREEGGNGNGSGSGAKGEGGQAA